MQATEREPIVVLIPGLWMPAWVLLPLAYRLRASGYRTVCFGYPSMRSSLDQNAQRLERFVRGLGDPQVYLVGHSLGGVLALHATATRGLVEVRRIVMAGSPYNDTYAGRKLSRWRWGRWILGRTVPQWLACDKPGAPQWAEVGVIAGTRPVGMGCVIAPGLGPRHDGVIRSAETVVRGMAAYTEVPVNHSGMLLSRRVAGLIAEFLRHGRFERGDGWEGHA